MSDPWDDPDTQIWAKRVREEMLPKLRSSALSATLITEGDPDVKLAVELGMSILLDKPLVVMVTRGAKVPDHLVRCADEIVELDLSEPFGAAERLRKAVARLQEKGLLPDE